MFFLQKSHCSVFNHPPSNDNEKVGITFYANCNLCDYKSTANAWKVSMQDTPTPPPKKKKNCGVNICRFDQCLV